MPTEPRWLDSREDRAWRAFKHAGYQLDVHMNRCLLQDSGLTQADYEVLAVLSGRRTDPMSARDLCAELTWEKSRLSHQTRGMQKRGLVTREPNPDDARSVMIRLLPAGRRAIENAAPAHVDDVRRRFIDLFSPAELDTLATLNERVLRHLADESSGEQSAAPDESRARH